MGMELPTSDIPTFNVNDDKMFTARHFGGGADKETGSRNSKIHHGDKLGLGPSSRLTNVRSNYLDWTGR